MSSFLCACFWSPQPKIPEEYLRPQGLYSLERVDLKKLKRLIRNQQLAPCHPGAEEPTTGQDLEECPICFLHYPVLNSSLCCQKRVCTECFLQVQTSTPPHQLSSCPFCKVTRPTGYLVKLIGARTAEEKEQERVEEQKVIEARIREREEEIRRDQERALQRQQQQQHPQHQQHTNAAATAGSENGSSATQQQQQPSAGVMAAAAAAASALDPFGGGNAANAASSAAEGRAAAARGGSAAAATAVAAAAVAADHSALGINGSVGGGGGGGSHGGHHYTVHYHSGDRHRWSQPAGTPSATGGPNATVVGGGGGGGGVYPTASARRAAAVAAISAAIQQHQQQQQHHHHHQQQQHPGDRHRSEAAVGAGGHPEGPEGTATAAYGSGAVGHHPRRNQYQGAGGGGGGGGGGRRYRLTDYVPAGVVDIAMGLDDINDLMLEQAMYESLAAAAAASSPPAAAAAAVAPTAGGDDASSAPGAAAVDGPNAGLDNDAALAEALAASLSGVGGTDNAALAERQSPVPPAASPWPAAAAGVGGSPPSGRPVGRPGSRQTSVRSGQLTAAGQPPGGGISSSVSARSIGGGGNRGGGATPAPPPPQQPSPSSLTRSVRANAVSSTSAAFAAMTPSPPALEGSRTQQQQRRQAVGAINTPPRVAPTRPTAPSHQPSFPGRFSTTTTTSTTTTMLSSTGGPQVKGGEHRGLGDGRGQLKKAAEVGEDEEEDGEALFSRRTGAVAALASPVAPPCSGPSSASRRAGAVECSVQEEDEAREEAQEEEDDDDATSVPGKADAAAAAASAVVLQFPGTTSQEQAGLLAAAAAAAPVGGASGAICEMISSSAGGPTPTMISPAQSDSPMGALVAHASDLSMTATGSPGGRGGELLGGAAVSGCGGGIGEQHVTNPLYDIWSNSSSATTCKHPCLGGTGPEEGTRRGASTGGGAAAGSSSTATAAAAGPSAAVLAHWGVKCGGSRQSSLGSEGGVAAGQPVGVPAGEQQQEEPKLRPSSALATSPLGDSAGVASNSRVTPAAQAQPSLRPRALVLDDEGPTSPTAVVAVRDSGKPASPPATTPSPHLGLPPLGLSPPPAPTAVQSNPPAAETSLADAAAADAASATTAVTIQTLAAELLRHGSGAATAAVAAAAGSADGGSSSSLQVLAVGMVFQVPDSAGAGAGGSQQRHPPHVQQPPKGPAWVQNPDGSLQVLLPAGGGNGGCGIAAVGSAAEVQTKQTAQHRRPVTDSNDIMYLPYTDYEVPELQHLPELGPVALDVPPDAAYIADGGNQPAPLAVEGRSPPGEAEAVDEALVQECETTDADLRRLVAEYDAVVAAAIASGDRLVCGGGGSAGGGQLHPQSHNGGQ